MEKVVTKKRLSILKKRRSRSVSPTKSPQFERRTSRRISFSGKHCVREFFIGDGNKTTWGAAYEESTEQLTHNSEQQSTLHMNRTKNETIRGEEAMECSSIIATASSTQLASATMAITSTFNRDRTMRTNVSIAVTEKENIPYVPTPKVRPDEQPSNTNKSMNISSVGPSMPKIKLFASMQQKRQPSPSDTLLQTKDMSLEMSLNSPIGISVPKSTLDETGRSPPSLRPQPTHRMNETNYNANMSVLVAPSRQSVICKSPSKTAMTRSRQNQTVNFGSDAMDVTQGAGGNNNLQESRYPLNAMSMNQSRVDETCMDQSDMDIPSKPAIAAASATTNPYLKFFLGGSSINSVGDRDESIKTDEVPVSNKRNVTAHEMFSITLDHSNGAELFAYPDAVPDVTINETKAPINEKNKTIHDQFSIDKSFDFVLPKPVVPIHDKENIFPLPPPPTTLSLGGRENNAPAVRVSLSDSVNTTVFNMHHDHIINSTCRSNNSNLEATLRQPEDPVSVSLDMSEMRLAQQTPILMPQLPRRATILCNESIQNEISQFPVLGNESIDITEPIVQPPVLVESKQRRVTCFNAEPIDITEPIVQPPVLVESKQRRVTCFNNEPIDITEPIVQPPVLVASKQRRVTCFRTEPIDESIAIDNVIHANEDMKLSMSPAAASPINATIHEGQMIIESTTSMPPIDHQRNASRRKTTIFENEHINAESSLNVLPASALDSYHHLTIEQTKLSSRETTVFQPNSTSLAAQSALLEPRMSLESSRPLDEYCQLTFIEDTVLDLVESLDSVDGDNDDCVVVNQSMDVSTQSRAENSLKNPQSRPNSRMSTSAFETRVGNSRISLASPLAPSIDERQAFKKSTLLRSSSTNVTDQNREMAVSTWSAAAATAAAVKRYDDYRRTTHKHEPMAIEINQSDANSTEMSYLHNVTVDKTAKDIKLDFSGYEKFKGLATPSDVCAAFVQRCEVFKQRLHQMREAAKLQDIPDPQSQNVEAPSLKFLFYNKLVEIDAENAAKFQAECDEKPIGALAPITPALLDLIKNKCKELKHWRFESLWFYRGRLILRHKSLHSYKFILDFDPEQKAVDDHINLYGKLMFTRARTMQCPVWLPRLRPIDRLRLHATIASEPLNLLQMCPSSNDLSAFDDKMHAIVRDACNKVTNIALAVIEANAILMIDDDLVYIHYRYDEREQLRFITCNITLSDIDRTGPENVQTIPFRALHNDVNALPKGVDFIHGFLRNAHKYLAQQV